MSATPAPPILPTETLRQLIIHTLPPARGRTMAVAGTLDSVGAPIVAGFDSHDGRWQFVGAYHHDWPGGSGARAKLMFTW